MRELGERVPPALGGRQAPPDAQLVVTAYYADKWGVRLTEPEVSCTRLDDPSIGVRLRNLRRVFGLARMEDSPIRRGYGGS